MCTGVVIDKEDKINNKVKMHAMRALYNLFSVRGTRVEYLNTERVQAGGINKDEAIEEYLKTKLNIFNKYEFYLLFYLLICKSYGLLLLLLL
jgi:hypothetical protein